jgi:signal transduction histidine kinase
MTYDNIGPMTLRNERALTLTCVADQSARAAALHEALTATFPSATIVRIDTDVEQFVADHVDCAVVDATVNGVDGVDVMRRIRACGYAGPAVLVLDPARLPSPSDSASAARLGARLCSLDDQAVVSLGSAVADALATEDGADPGTAAAAALRAVRQTQRLIAAGELAMRLQHSLNNPLAALLAEAQLLELETLPPDHRESVERIIELCRRVIEVVRGLDGVGRV